MKKEKKQNARKRCYFSTFGLFSLNDIIVSNGCFSGFYGIERFTLMIERLCERFAYHLHPKTPQSLATTAFQGIKNDAVTGTNVSITASDLVGVSGFEPEAP